MRSKDIQWGSNKSFILEYLHSYSKTILNNKSFLNKENRNILFDNLGCSYHMTDPLFVPQNCYWVILNMDKPFFCKSMEEIWDKLLIDEPYFNKMRQVLLEYINENHKDKNIDILIENLYKKYNVKKIFVNERVLIENLLKKNTFAKTKSQLFVWSELVEKSKSNSSELMSSSNLAHRAAFFPPDF